MIAIGMGVAVGGMGLLVGAMGVGDASMAGKFGVPPEQAVSKSKIKIRVRFKGYIGLIIPDTIKPACRLLAILDRVLAQWLLSVQFPDDAQAIQGQPWRDMLDDGGFFCHDFCQPACGDHLHLGAKFLAEAFYHTLHHANIPEQ